VDVIRSEKIVNIYTVKNEGHINHRKTFIRMTFTIYQSPTKEPSLT